MEKYNFTFSKIVNLLLPSFLRKLKMVSWIVAMCKALRDLHQLFIAWGGAKREEIKYTGQTIVLENLLIKKFGGGIYIENALVDSNSSFIGVAGDVTMEVGYGRDQVNYIGSQYSLISVNFTVYVPEGLIFDQAVMEAIINQYKLYSTQYEIKTYTP